MTLGADAVPVVPRGVRLHYDSVRDAWVLLAPERAMRLDAIGQAILNEIDGNRSLGAIAERLATRYGAPPEEVGRDCAEFVAGLVDRRILDIAS